MSTLSRLMETSRRRSPFFAKDLAKAEVATRFIGQGSPASSTAAYAEAMAPLANLGSYGPDDVVFVSSEGNRRGRFAAVVDGRPQGAYADLDAAMAAGAVFVVDVARDRGRDYNVGEREVAAHLVARGWIETSPGRFEGAARDGRRNGAGR